MNQWGEKDQRVFILNVQNANKRRKGKSDLKRLSQGQSERAYVRVMVGNNTRDPGE